MPIYEYRCNQCGETFEYMQRMSDDPRTECEGCGGALERLISRTSFHLKGGGWYKDLYASPRADAPGETSPDTSADKSPDTPTKPGAATDSGSSSGTDSGSSSGSGSDSSTSGAASKSTPSKSPSPTSSESS